MHYKAKPFVLSSSGGGEGGRAASYTPRSATNTTRPVNDLRCMPVYEELDGADDLLPTRPQVYTHCLLTCIHVRVYMYVCFGDMETPVGWVEWRWTKVILSKQSHNVHCEVVCVCVYVCVCVCVCVVLAFTDLPPLPSLPSSYLQPIATIKTLLPSTQPTVTPSTLYNSRHSKDEQTG